MLCIEIYSHKFSTANLYCIVTKYKALCQASKRIKRDSGLFVKKKNKEGRGEEDKGINLIVNL